MHIINTLLPVFLLIVLGFALRWRGLISSEVFAGMKWLVYWIGLPALLVHKIIGVTLSREIINSLGIVLIATGVIVVASLVLALVLRIKAERVGTFVQASFRGNLAFVGLPVVIYAFSSGVEGAEIAEQIAMLTIGPLVVAYNITAVVALLASQHKFGLAAVKKMFLELCTNPLVLACVVGIIGAVAGFKLPSVLGRTLGTLGGMTLPLALLCVGGALLGMRISGNSLLLAAVVLLKLVLAPLAGYATAMAIGAGPVETGVAMILLSTPCAVAGYVMADQLDGDSSLAASAVAVTTILSIIPLAVVVGYI